MRLKVALLAIAVALAATAIACGGGGGSTKTPAASATRLSATPATSLAPTATVQETTPFPTVPNAPPPGVTGQPTVTSSGLQIYELQVGTGKEAKAGSIVQIRYTEWLSTGRQIENTGTEAVRENLTPGRVLQGWLEGIAGMKEGGKRRLVIPANLAYGTQGDGDTVPPNATIIDDIELVAVIQ